MPGDPTDTKQPPETENEGEGNKSADRAYRQKVREFIDTDDPARRAREAAEDLDRDPARYAEAERTGKSRIAEEDPEDKKLI